MPVDFRKPGFAPVSAVSDENFTRRLPDMIGVLASLAPSSDAEALGALRRAFPAAPLADRVAVIAQWRSVRPMV